MFIAFFFCCFNSKTFNIKNDKKAVYDVTTPFTFVKWAPHLVKVESMLNSSENSISYSLFVFSLLFLAITFLKTSIFYLYSSTTFLKLSRSMLFFILSALYCSNSSFRRIRMSCWIFMYFSYRESLSIFSLRFVTKCSSWSSICLDKCSSLDRRFIVSFYSLS